MTGPTSGTRAPVGGLPGQWLQPQFQARVRGEMLAEPSPLHVPCWDSLGRWRGRAGLVLGAFRQFSLGPWNGKQHPEFTGL